MNPRNSMAALTESGAAFESRASEVGLSSDEVDILKAKGVTTLSRLAYALTQPGSAPSEESLKGLLAAVNGGGDPASVGAVSALRRLIFEAQTLAMSEVRALAEAGEDRHKAELPSAERRDRVVKQRARLGGLDLGGELACSHCSYSTVLQMQEQDQLLFLRPSRFATRRAEKPSRSVSLDAANQLVLKESTKEVKCDVSSELSLSQALCRRSLAFDLVGVASYDKLEAWSRHLMHHLQMEPPPSYAKVGVDQTESRQNRRFFGWRSCFARV